MGAEEERAPWTGGQCIRAAVPQWPQARPFCSLGLSFFICTTGGGSLLGWRTSKPRTRIGVTLSLTRLACPALCPVPPHGHLDELRLSWLPFPVQETEAQTRVAIGLGKSRR